MGIWVGVGLAAIVVLAACGSGSEETGSQTGAARTLAEGRRRAQEMVDQTLARVGGDRGISDAPAVDPAPCDEPGGAPSSTLFTEDYGKRIDLGDGADADELIRETRRYWQDQGYAVDVRDMDTRVPVVFAEVDGFNLSLQVVRDKSLAEIGASTPCLPAG